MLVGTVRKTGNKRSTFARWAFVPSANDLDSIKEGQRSHYLTKNVLDTNSLPLLLLLFLPGGTIEHQSILDRRVKWAPGWLSSSTARLFSSLDEGTEQRAWTVRLILLDGMATVMDNRTEYDRSTTHFHRFTPAHCDQWTTLPLVGIDRSDRTIRIVSEWRSSISPRKRIFLQLHMAQIRFIVRIFIRFRSFS